MRNSVAVCVRNARAHDRVIADQATFLCEYNVRRQRSLERVRLEDDVSQVRQQDCAVSIGVPRDEIQIAIVAGVSIDSHPRAKATKPIDDDAMRQQNFDHIRGGITNQDAYVTIEGRVPERAQEWFQLPGRQVPPGPHDQIGHRRRLALSMFINGDRMNGFTTMAGTVPPTRTPRRLSILSRRGEISKYTSAAFGWMITG